ncbi:MAG: hypothetical protein K2X66_00580 [Cyanobacteria bacterium]|nr:hypothetical protein [Cyanobacteriota bacterium]
MTGIALSPARIFTPGVSFGLAVDKSAIKPPMAPSLGNDLETLQGEKSQGEGAQGQGVTLAAPSSPNPKDLSPKTKGHGESPLKAASERYYRIAPLVDATVAAVTTSGNGLAKSEAGGLTLANRFGTRVFGGFYDRILQGVTRKHPGFGRLIEEHPVTVGIPMVVATSTLCSYSGDLSKKGFQWAFGKVGKPLVEKVMSVLPQRVQNFSFSGLVKSQNPSGRVPAFAKEGGRLLEAGLRHPGAKWMLGLVSVLSTLTLTTHLMNKTLSAKAEIQK